MSQQQLNGAALVTGDMAERCDAAAELIRAGEVVGMVGVMIFKDGSLRFGIGGAAAESHQLAVKMTDELHSRLVALLQ